MTLLTRLRRGVVAGLAATALGGAGLLTAAAPAQAAACSSADSGVTVVVTFPGGSTSVRCAPGDPSSGAAALQGAGFSTTQVQTQPGFICRIDGAPSSDPCVRTPPTSAYWSYWSASPGGSWTYQSVGAYGRDPAPGTVDGWSFGAGTPPAIAPPRIEAPAPPPPPPPPSTTPAPAPSTSSAAPAPRPSTSSSAPAPRTTSSSAAPAPGSSSSAPAPRSTTSGATETATEAGTETAAPTESATATETVTEAATESATESVTGAATEDAVTGTDDSEDTVLAGTLEDTGGDAGSSAGTIAGLGVAGLLLGAAGWMGWRRRAAP